MSQRTPVPPNPFQHGATSTKRYYRRHDAK